MYKHKNASLKLLKASFLILTHKLQPPHSAQFPNEQFWFWARLGFAF